MKPYFAKVYLKKALVVISHKCLFLIVVSISIAEATEKISIFYNATLPFEQMTSVAGTLPCQLEENVMAFHCSIVPLKIIVVSEVQLKKASLPIKVKVLGKVILSSDVQ